MTLLEHRLNSISKTLQKLEQEAFELYYRLEVKERTQRMSRRELKVTKKKMKTIYESLIQLVDSIDAIE